MSSWDRKYTHWINKEFAETRAPLAEIQGEPHSCVQRIVNPGVTCTVQDIDRKGKMKPSKVCSTKMFSFSLQPFLFSTKKLLFWLILPFPPSPVKDLLDSASPERRWWSPRCGLLLLCSPHTSLGLTGLLPALLKLCWSMRKAEHMVFGLHFWHHKAGPTGLTLDYVPISDIRPSEEQPVLIRLCSTSPVMLPQDILSYSSRVLLWPA